MNFSDQWSVVVYVAAIVYYAGKFSSSIEAIRERLDKIERRLDRKEGLT